MAIYKKALPFLLVLTLFITLTACDGEYQSMGNDNNPTESSEPSATPQLGETWPDNEFTRQIPNPGFEVHSVTTNSNNCNITFSNTTIEQLKEYVETVKDAGFTTILAQESEINGVTHYLYTARNASGYEIVVTQSISYSILTINKAVEGSGPSPTQNSTDMGDSINMENSNQLGGNWPDNEFTRQVPTPGFEVHSVTTNSNSCNITFTNTTIDQLKEYVETIKNAGFTTILTRENEMNGMKHYLYTARNASGYEIVITQSVSYSILSITKL